MKKKIFSLILVIVMILSMTVNVSAAGLNIDDAEEIVLNEKYTENIEYSKNQNWYKFTAKEAGYYIVVYNQGNSNQQIMELCDDMGKVLDKTYWAYDVDTLSVKLEKNEICYLKVKLTVKYNKEELYEPTPYSFIVQMNKDKEGSSFDESMELKLNQKEICSFDGEGDKDYFVFCGKKENKYKFELEDISGNDEIKKCKILDDNQNELDTIYSGQNLFVSGYDKYYIKMEYSTRGYVMDFEEPHKYSLKVNGNENESSLEITEDKCHHTNTHKSNGYVGYEKIKNDEKIHYRIEYYDVVCRDCELELEEDVQGAKNKENHVFDGNSCQKCGFEKEEEEAPEIYSLECLEGNKIDIAKTSKINIKATVSDNAESVEFFLSGIGSIGKVKCKNGYSTMTLDTGSIYTGANSVSAVAYDANGNTSDYVDVYFETVKNENNIAGSFSPTPQQGDISVTVKGNYVNFDVPPQIINDRTMIPVRAVAEALDASIVDWDEEAREVRILLPHPRGTEDTWMVLTIGSNQMYVCTVMYEDSTERYITLDSPAIIVDGRTLIPLRAIAEATGYTVDWNDATKTVSIY